MMKRLSTLAIFALLVMFTRSAFAQVNVKFQIDMGIYMQLKTDGFNAATDSLFVRGDWQTMAGDTANWKGDMWKLTPSQSNDSIYTVTATFPDSAVGKSIQFKYVIINTAHPENSGLNGGMWEGIDNRTYTITSDKNQSTPLAYFNGKTTLGITVNITFQADMGSLINQGFTTSSDSIEARGNTAPLDWGPGKTLSQGLINPQIFSVTLSFSGTPGDTVQWKFHCDPENHFANSGWEQNPPPPAIGGNRILIFPHADTTVGPIKPDINVAIPTTAADTVTFMVDMNGARETYHNSLITGLKSVWMGGSVSPLQWPSSWLLSDTAQGGTLIKMYDDGTHGDETAGDKIFTNVEVFAAASPSPVFYKYGAVFEGVDTLGGGARPLDNEAPNSINHVLKLNTSGGSQSVTNKFGDQVTSVEEQPSGNLPTQYSLSQNYPNPFNPTTSINYSIPKSSMVTLKVYNVLGQQVATIFQGFQNAGHYKASFDASRLASGIYLYRIQAGNFTLTKKMILLK